MTAPKTFDKARAIQDFRRARRQAAFQEILARFTGQSFDLLSYDEVRQKLRLTSGSSRGLKDIRLDDIVGSVSRYQDFTRNFLPRQDDDLDRWAKVEAATLELSGLPPIEVYQVGKAYFVVDGNHRVSVARQLGATHIQAYVTEFQTKVPLEPGDDLDDILIKAEFAEFLERTALDQLRPGTSFKITTPNRYWELMTQIEAVHYHLKDQEPSRKVPYSEAVLYWHDQVYLPIIQIIRERGILRDFPGRTETDLYLWILRHQSRLSQRLGWQIGAEPAALDLVSHHSVNLGRVVARIEEKILDSLLPDQLEDGPEPGRWRREWLDIRPRDRLFGTILVPLSGEAHSWCALEQAVLIAQREGAQLYGLTIIPSADPNFTENAQEVREKFDRRCAEAGVSGQLSVEVGPIARTIIERAVWADLVVMNLAHPPESHLLGRLNSGFRTVLHRCSRPVLAVPGEIGRLERALLAYDGSPKAQEGLIIASYLAGHWPLSLTVLTVEKSGIDESHLAEARDYLDSHEIAATFISARGEVAPTLLQTAREHRSDLLIMGGYGFKPVLEVMLGGSVDQVLRQASQPILICR